MKQLPVLCAVVVLACGLSGCSSGDDGDPARESAASGPGGESSRIASPSTGEAALQVGQTRSSGYVDSTVVEIGDKFDRERTDVLPVLVQVCITKNPKNLAVPFSWDLFQAGSKDGYTWQADAAAVIPILNRFPTPEFPGYENVVDGCRKGWIAFAFKPDDKPDRIQLVDPTNDTVAGEWTFDYVSVDPVSPPAETTSAEPTPSTEANTATSELSDLASAYDDEGNLWLTTDLEGQDLPEVREVQVALNQRGYGVVVDGSYGPQTAVAVRNFQQQNGLVVDGIVGPETYEYLIFHSGN